MPTKTPNTPTNRRSPAATDRRVRVIPRAAVKRSGGRPKVYNYERVQLNTRTLRETRDWLREQADQMGLSINELVDKILVDYQNSLVVDTPKKKSSKAA